jgi:hypothetical protein
MVGGAEVVAGFKGFAGFEGFERVAGVVEVTGSAVGMGYGGLIKVDGTS